MMDKNIDKKLITHLEAIGTNFFENFPDNYYDLQYFNEKYFEPFNEYLTDYLARTRNNNPMVLEFAAYTRDAKQTFQQIKNGKIGNCWLISVKQVRRSIQNSLI
jgi:hypothetical protein